MPDWASDANYPSGANRWSGEPTKIAPEPGDITGGAVPIRTFPAQRFNWLLNRIGKWIEWFEAGTIQFADLPGQTDAVDGSKVFVSGMGHYDYQSSAAFTADGVNVVDATGMGVGQWIHESVAFDNLSSVASTGDVEARTVISRVLLKEIGWYSWTSDTSLTADGLWVITATGIGAGQWRHEHRSAAQFKMIAPVGPVPGGLPATADRIPKSIIDHGYFTHVYVDAATTTTTSGSPDTTETFNLGTSLLPGDIIKAHIPAMGQVSASTAFTVAPYISSDDGSSYGPLLAAVDPTYRATTGDSCAVVCDFNYVVGSNTGIRVALKGSVGAGILSLVRGAALFEVIRP